MEVRTPRPAPIGDGDYQTYTDAAYGNPYGTIHLAEGYSLDLADVHVDDCDRLIRAASRVRDQLLGFQAKMAAPHGRKHLWHATCQLCGKPEDDELHAEPEAAGAAAVLAASIAAGVPLTVYDDEARCECGHLLGSHDVACDSRCLAVVCGCARFSDAASAAS
jgi:hypothetical protein